MAGIPREIKINTAGAGIIFDPNPRDANILDQIFWHNFDDKPHWPGLADNTGKVTDPTFFMDSQIPPGGSSGNFGASEAKTYLYACSLHPNEKGTIQVT